MFKIIYLFIAGLSFAAQAGDLEEITISPVLYNGRPIVSELSGAANDRVCALHGFDYATKYTKERLIVNNGYYNISQEFLKLDQTQKPITVSSKVALLNWELTTPGEPLETTMTMATATIFTKGSVQDILNANQKSASKRPANFIGYSLLEDASGKSIGSIQMSKMEVFTSITCIKN